jgi:AICAR transformylase/IMP cyclohydrolase PurH
MMCLTACRGRGVIGMIDVGGVVVVRSAGRDDETVMMVMNEVQ